MRSEILIRDEVETPYLPLLDTRPDINLIRKAPLALHMQTPIRLRNILRIDLRVRRQVHAVVLASGDVYRPVDVGPCDVNALRAELLGKRCGECAFGEVGGGEGCHVRVSFNARRGAREDESWRVCGRVTLRMV